MIGTLHGGEIIVLILAALVILGPSQLPGYAAKLGQGVRYLRDLAEGAKGQLKDELGPGYEDIDWRQLDPRQYDPRRIVREALSTPSATVTSRRSGTDDQERGEQGAPKPVSAGAPRRVQPVRDPSLPTPFDVDAT